MALFTYTMLFLQLTTVFSHFKSHSTHIAEISLQSIEDHITNRQWTQPLCILFLEKTQNIAPGVSKYNYSVEKVAQRIRKVEQDLVKVQNLPHFVNWTVRKFYFQEKSLPQLLSPAWDRLIRCFIGTASPHDFDSTMTLKHWMWQLKMVFSERIEIHLDDSLNALFQRDLDSQFFIIAVPGSNFFGTVEASLFEVRKFCERCRILIAPPESPFERTSNDKSPSQVLPTILIYHREKERIMPKLKEVLQGLHSSQREHVLLRILILRSKADVFTLNNFESALMLVRRSKEPLVICFYSSSNPESFIALHAFERSVLYYNKGISKDPYVSLHFGLIDLAVGDNAKIISRYLDALSLKKIPFVAIFWGDYPASTGHATDKVDQRIINDMVPTPWNIHVLLKELHLIPEEPINRFEIHVCSSNMTIDTCLVDEKPAVYFGPEFSRTLSAKKKNRKVKPLMKTLLDIPLVTDKLWSQIIENTLPMKVSIFGQNSNFMQPAAVKLVIFIMADCGYCEKMMPSFANLTKSARRLYKTSVYLMNCTSDPVQCKRNGVTGYPTLALFRTVSEEESKNCLLPNSTSSSVRLDYHGNMQVNDILSWLSKSSMSAVNLTFEDNKLRSLNKDVRLVAHVYTKKLASKYLSRWLQQKLIPFQCFKLACEMLFGTVECFAKPSMDVITEDIWKGKIIESDLTLDQVTFERRDGASTTIFKLSYPMENTIERGHGTGLHKFHNKHRYSIPHGFRCEDNHPLCTDILVKFVEDHQRLPITHITRESFHVHGTSASIFSKEFPLLLALVHANNISRNSSFLRELDKVAQNLYTKLIVATLNVDEFPSWASQFVPRDYHYTHHESLDRTPALYHYPRFCIIEWDDHQHAAFYPPVDELEQSKDVGQSLSSMTAKNIIDFTENYFHSKDRIILETEMF